jgi:3-isopropylmalate/(R)-2-methylmalate dehydratase small subunit
MKAVDVVRGRAIPLDRAHVDTDQIIPAKHLKRIERTGYGPLAFEAWRADPDFVLNDAAYRGATIMLTRENFGCGSSREHAVWALEGLGIEAVIGVSFADIFASNAFQGGLLTVVLPEPDIDRLMALVEADPSTELVVDVPEQTVSTWDGSFSSRFEIDEYRKHRLVGGLDDISLTLECQDEISGYESGREAWLPITAAQ